MDKHDFERSLKKESLGRAHRLQGQMMEEMIATPLSLEITQSVIELEKNLIYIYFHSKEYEGCVRGEFMRDGTVLPHWAEMYVASIPLKLPKRLEEALEEAQHSMGIGVRIVDKAAGFVIGRSCASGNPMSIQETLDFLCRVTSDLRKRCADEERWVAGEMPSQQTISVN